MKPVGDFLKLSCHFDLWSLRKWCTEGLGVHIKFLKWEPGQKIWRHFMKEVIGMAYKVMKKAFKSEKCKLKPQWNTTSWPTE